MMKAMLKDALYKKQMKKNRDKVTRILNISGFFMVNTLFKLSNFTRCDVISRFDEAVLISLYNLRSSRRLIISISIRFGSLKIPHADSYSLSSRFIMTVLSLEWLSLRCRHPPVPTYYLTDSRCDRYAT